MDRTAWLKERQQGIGSSDVAAILGISPYTTAFEVYQSKVGEVQPESGNFITDMGNKFEPMIRKLIENDRFEKYPPVRVVHHQYPYLVANLDGESENKSTIIEIKIVGKDVFEAARDRKEIPEHYKAQMRHQLGVTGAKRNLFVAHLYEKGMTEVSRDKMVVIEMLPNQQEIADQMKKVMAFWNDHVLKRVPPKDESKYETLEPTAEVSTAFDTWKKLQIESKALDIKIQNARDVLLTAAKDSGHKKIEFAGVRMRQEFKKGSVDYKKIPAVAGMSDEEFEKYRGEGAWTWKLEAVKEKSEKSKSSKSKTDS